MKKRVLGWMIPATVDCQIRSALGFILFDFVCKHLTSYYLKKSLILHRETSMWSLKGAGSVDRTF